MKRFLPVLLVAAFAPALAFAQLDLQPAAIVKLTKSEPITVKAYKSEIAKAETQTGRTLTKDERRQVLDVMINEALALQAAEKDKIVVSDAEINEQLKPGRQSLAAKLGRTPTDKELEDAVKAETGMAMADFKETMRKQLTVQKLMMARKRAIFDALKGPTEAEILKSYDISKAQLVQPDTVRLNMIFVPRGGDSASQAKAKDLANKLASQIGQNAAKFDEAYLKSQTPDSGYQAGDFGYLPKNEDAARTVGQEFLNTAFSLKPGEVSKLLEVPRGYQIMKITESLAQRQLTLEDTYPLGTKSTLKDFIANRIFQQKQQATIQQASKELIDELRTGKPNPPFSIKEENLNW